jgi:hypothetical protein
MALGPETFRVRPGFPSELAAVRLRRRLAQEFLDLCFEVKSAKNPANHAINLQLCQVMRRSGRRTGFQIVSGEPGPGSLASGRPGNGRLEDLQESCTEWVRDLTTPFVSGSSFLDYSNLAGIDAPYCAPRYSHAHENDGRKNLQMRRANCWPTPFQ